MKIYIACGLTHVPRNEFNAYVALIERLAEQLESKVGAEIKYALRHSDPQLAEKPFSDRAHLCYLWDREMVEWADAVIAESSYPSTGLGIELQIASSQSTPIVLAFKLDERHRAEPINYKTPDQHTHSLQLGEGYVSLMALGIPSIFKVIPYQDTEDAIIAISETIQTLALPTRTQEI
jgi:hypothetical protein